MSFGCYNVVLIGGFMEVLKVEVIYDDIVLERSVSTDIGLLMSDYIIVKGVKYKKLNIEYTFNEINQSIIKIFVRDTILNTPC